MCVLKNGAWSKESLYFLSSVQELKWLKSQIVREGLIESGLIHEKTEFFEVYLLSEGEDRLFVEKKDYGFEIKLEHEVNMSKVYYWVGDWSDFWSTLEEYRVRLEER